MGSVPPVDSMRISDHNTPVEMCTEATFDMAMLSSLLPKNRDFTRLTRTGLTTMRVGKRKLPCVQRLAEKLSTSVSGGVPGVRPMASYPLQGAFPPDPDIAHDQNQQEEDGDDVIANGIAAAGAVDGIDAALIRHQLGLARIFRPHQLGQQQGQGQQASHHCDENEDRDVVLRHSASSTPP